MAPSQMSQVRPSFTPENFSVRPLRAFDAATFPLSFQTIVKEINAAVQNGLPRTKKQYSKVSVLMFHWDIDDMGVRPFEDELARVFRELFKYRVEHYELEAYPSKLTCGINLLERIAAFTRKYSGNDNLMIFVYSGHAHAGPEGSALREYQCDLFGARVPPGAREHPHITWNSMRTMPDEMPGDTLYILDCCFAAQAAVYKQDTEYLAASAFQIEATGDVERCLTNRLTNLLTRCHGQAMTVAEYTSYLISEYRHPDTIMDNTPVYVPSSSKPSIVLAPIGRGTEASQLETVNINDGKVIVTISLTGHATLPSVQQFEEYLVSQIPTAVADIKVEAAFGAPSLLLIVSMPTTVWAVLKENPSINFVAHVTTPNILARPPASTELEMGLRGSENIAFASRSQNIPK